MKVAPNLINQIEQKVGALGTDYCRWLQFEILYLDFHQNDCEPRGHNNGILGNSVNFIWNCGLKKKKKKNQWTLVL